MGRDVIIACDFPSKEATLEFLKPFESRKPYVKIGMELFYSEGPDIVRELKAKGYRVFLDLKLHDIPHTVEMAMTSLAKLGADMTNVHAAGGRKMMEAAVRGLEAGSQGRETPILLAVTQLTSTSKEMMNEELGIPGEVRDTVISYARNAKAAGLQGVVCSPLEAADIHQACGGDFFTITPGIRFEGAPGDDQTRVTTPARAGQIGSDYIVVGRPITKAEDPVAAYDKCVRDFTGREPGV